MKSIGKKLGLSKGIREFTHYYLLALWTLIGYYVGTWLGITTWAFDQNIVLMFIVLTAFYGTWLLVGDKVLHMYWIGEK